MKRFKNNRFSIMLVLTSFLATLGYSILIYPSVAGMLSEDKGSDATEDYQNYYESLSEQENEQEKEEAIAYNEKLFKAQKKEPYHYQGAEATDEEYENILKDNGVLCLLEIPSINLYLPVSHGTGDREMQYEAGHFYGTSLPVGGENTHAGIAAHSALSSASLFTDLEKVEKGDFFYIHVLNEIHTYQVDQILTVLPEEADEHLQIVEGKDMITLYTCTPYGINSHRLLVRGNRVMEDEEADEMVTLKSEDSAQNNRLGMAFLLAAGPFLISYLYEKRR